MTKDRPPLPVTQKDEEKSECWQRGTFAVRFWRKDGLPKYSLEQLRAACLEGRKPDYVFFWKPESSPDGRITESCFSQWWSSGFCSDAHTYCCMEQYMMAGKAELFDDEPIRKQILESRDPKQIKALGRKVRNFDEAVWDKVKHSIVLNGNFLKFTQNPALQDFLLSTGDRVLVEASPLDSIWGIRMSRTNEQARNPLSWKGKNLLGFALMEVRDEIRRIRQHADLCQPAEESW